MDKEKEITKEYISLQKATQCCSYSQEYLSLRARQKKLKALKFGRNWVTKKEWLDEYLQKVEEYKNNNFRVKEFISPSDNLPVEEVLKPKLFNFPKLKPAFTLMLVFVLLITGFIFIQGGSRDTFEKLNFFVAGIKNSSLKNFPSFTYINILEPSYQTMAAMGSPEVLKETLETFKEFGQWVKKGVSVQLSKIKGNFLAIDYYIKTKITQEYRAITQLFKKPTELELKEEKLTPQPTKEGIVIIPSQGKDEEILQKIKTSFSDEVKVKPEDETSGIIIPVFKEREGEKYLYILVPIKN